MRSNFYLFSVQILVASASNSTQVTFDNHFRLLRGKGQNGEMARGYGHGGGGMMNGNGYGGGNGARREMMMTIHNLFDSVADIKREVNETLDGVETYTYSPDKVVASWIKTHVNDMKQLMEQGRGGIRLWDDLFEKAFQYHNFNTLEITEYTDDGVKVRHEVNNDNDQLVNNEKLKECVVAIIHEHATVVSDFATVGMEEAHKNHAVPDICA